MPMPSQDSASPQPTAPQRKTSRWLVAPLIIFSALAAMFYYALQSGDPSRLPSALIGKPAPQLTLDPVPDLVNNGQPVRGLAPGDLTRGRVSVVNFWASWCVPCVQEHPLLVELKRRTDIDLFGINYKDQAPAARRFLGRYGNPFTAVGVDSNGRAAIEWGVYGMPETFVVDGAGRIVYKHVGPISLETLEKQMLPAIEAARNKQQKPGNS
jgi:cytochrome c biogenesis protein CcmG/thiol:disulfide interchange protein DsbE